jgi:hypothetical protein
MNDPHGMFELNGTTHVFMQYNPKAIQWGEWAVIIIIINPCKPYLTASAPRLTHWGGGK